MPLKLWQITLKLVYKNKMPMRSHLLPQPELFGIISANHSSVAPTHSAALPNREWLAKATGP